MRIHTKVNTPRAGNRRAPKLRRTSGNAASAMRAWLDVASAKQKRQLAATAQVKVNYLYKIASGYRKPSVDLAARLAAASHLVKGTPLLWLKELTGVLYYEGRTPWKQ